MIPCIQTYKRHTHDIHRLIKKLYISEFEVGKWHLIDGVLERLRRIVSKDQTNLLLVYLLATLHAY